jgi:hypothetical protein
MKLFMSIFNRLFRSRERPKNNLFGSTYSFFFGSTTSGKIVNERTAMQTTAVYACVRILSETLASLPLHTYRHTERGKEKAIDHNLYYFRLSAPLNPTFRTLEPHGKIVSAQQGFVRISRTVLYPNIGGRISAGLSQTPRRS